MSGKNKIIVSLVLGIFFSGLALYFAFRNIPLRELFEYLTTINYWWVVPAVLVSLTAFVVRVIRWQLLLGPMKAPTFLRAFHPLMIGFAMNCILPARLGEVARPAIFSKKEKVPFFRVLATVGAERVFDLIVLLIFFVLTLAFVEIDPILELPFGGYILNKAMLENIAATSSKVAFLLIVGMVFVSLHWSRNIMKRIILGAPGLLFFSGQRLKDKIHTHICVRLVAAVDNVAAGFELIKSPRSLSLCVFLSFLVWVLGATAYYILSFGCPGVDVTFFEMTASMVIICFFISLPSVPGFWGLWEAGGVFALLVFGVHAKEAMGFTLTNHVVQMVPVTIVGLLSSLITGVGFLKLSFDKKVE